MHKTKLINTCQLLAEAIAVKEAQRPVQEQESAVKQLEERLKRAKQALKDTRRREQEELTSDDILQDLGIGANNAPVGEKEREAEPADMTLSLPSTDEDEEEAEEDDNLLSQKRRRLWHANEETMRMRTTRRQLQIQREEARKRKQPRSDEY